MCAAQTVQGYDVMCAVQTAGYDIICAVLTAGYDVMCAAQTAQGYDVMCVVRTVRLLRHWDRRGAALRQTGGIARTTAGIRRDLP